MNNIVNSTVLLLLMMLFSSCGNNDCPTIEEVHTYTGINLGNVIRDDRCGYEINIIKGLEKVHLISDVGDADSLFYTKSIPVQVGDTFSFTARKSNNDEFYTCNPMGIAGYKQIVIKKIIK